MEKTFELPSPMKPTKSDRWTVDVADVEIEEGFNRRVDYGDMEWLIANIMENGQLEDCVAYKKRGEDKYVLIEGHRRHRAIVEANKRGVYMRIKLVSGSSNPEDRYLAQLITGVGKKQLNAVEEGEIYKQMQNFGWDVTKLQLKTGKSLPHIYNCIALANSPQKVKNLIFSGEISASTVTQVIREVKDYSQIVDVIEAAVTDAKGSGKKATLKNVKSEKVVKAVPFAQKLREAYDLLDKKKKVTPQLERLIELLNDNKSTVKQIASVFEQE